MAFRGSKNVSTKKHSALGHDIVWIMALACGIGVANLYYNQPLLAQMGRSFHVGASQVGFISMLTQIGYAVGMLLFVPLGDRMERRQLIVTLIILNVGALAAVAVSPSLVWLIVASLAVGITTVVPQLIVPLAAGLAVPEERGRVVGSVMSGLLFGVLLARTVSGFVGASLGWRAMYWIAAGLMIFLAVILARLLPLSQPEVQLSYAALLRSLPGLIRTQPVLREASLTGAMLFGAFSCFWTTLTFLLEQPPYHYGSQVAGLFGLIGVVGAAAAPRVGKLADLRSPRLTVGLAIAITIGAFLVFWLFGHQLWGLIAGVLLLDLGTQAGQVSNQARIYSLLPEAHNRLNTIYMVSYFIGGSLGSYLGAYSWSVGQWNGVCLVGFLMLGFGLFVYYQARNPQQGSNA